RKAGARREEERSSSFRLSPSVFFFLLMKLPRGFWPILATALATIPVAGMFTLTRLFYVRDLTMAFRPRFQFLRHAVQSGTFPLWDPYTAHGQPAINDALYQLFHLPTLLLRLLLPETIGYNLW